MALLLKGEEFVTTEALSVNMWTGLMRLARQRPLRLNGMELRAEDLARSLKRHNCLGDRSSLVPLSLK
ncbi:MAG: hypothetical protein QOC96_1716 [Acidobacteriota bacterium]|jgi:hypothetical protein|nr:hypothetical protein [Acidobacteriota bacterium]